jgi:hypothetical protein
LTVAMAAARSGTSKHRWCRPPSGFFSRNLAIGDFAPSGYSN